MNNFSIKLYSNYINCYLHPLLFLYYFYTCINCVYKNKERKLYLYMRSVIFLLHVQELIKATNE